MTDPKKRFKEIMEEMNTLYQKKNADYGDSFHRAWKKFGSTVGLVYMDAKMNRIDQLLAHPEAQQIHSEKIEDTLIALANYAVLTIMEEQRLGYETALCLIRPQRKASDIVFSSTIEQNLSRLKLYVNETHDWISAGICAVALMIQLEEQREGKTEHPTPADTECGTAHQVRIILEEGGILPQKATDGSAGYDLFAPEHVVINPGRNLVKLNFRLALPKGVGATPESRSGFTLKGFEGYRQYGAVGNSNDDAKLVPMGESSRMDADVQWGLIDSDYRGICGVLVISHEKEPFLLAKGTKFAQMCFQRYEDVSFIPVDNLDETERKGGFGHTGTK